MAKFFVGCRVRLVQATKVERNGWEGVITSITHNPKGTPTRSGIPLQHDCDCVVLWGEDMGNKYATAFWQIEPILPEGAQPLGYSFEQMMSEFGVEETVK